MNVQSYVKVRKAFLSSHMATGDYYRYEGTIVRFLQSRRRVTGSGVFNRLGQKGMNRWIFRHMSEADTQGKHFALIGSIRYSKNCLAMKDGYQGGRRREPVLKEEPSSKLYTSLRINACVNYRSLNPGIRVDT